MQQSWMTVTVAKKTVEALDIALFELTSSDGSDLPPFSAGAHVEVEIKPGVSRQYSLCNNPVEHHRYAIAVLKDPASRGGSVAMHDVKAGDKIRISEPRNHFPLTADAPRSLLLAGGIGVTPILCMAERLSQIGAPFEMHYCVRSRDRMAFGERIAAATFADRVHLHFDDAGPEQRLDIEQALRDLGPDGHLYACGPGGFLEFVLNAAQSFGLPEKQLHREYFSPPASSLVPAEGGAFKVKIASTGALIEIPANKPVTAALAEHGIEIVTSCEEGVCGTCLTRILEGTPEHRDFYLSHEEKESGAAFMPCCSRSKTALLVLDL